MTVTKIGFQVIERLFQGQISATSIQLMKDEKIDLEKTFQETYWDGSMGSNKDQIEVFVWDMKNGLKKLHINIGEYSGSNYAHSDTTNQEGERLIDALLRLDTCPTHIAIRNWGYSSWEGSQSSHWDRLKVYRIDHEDVRVFAEKEEVEQKQQILEFFGIGFAA